MISPRKLGEIIVPGGGRGRRTRLGTMITAATQSNPAG